MMEWTEEQAEEWERQYLQAEEEEIETEIEDNNNE